MKKLLGLFLVLLVVSPLVGDKKVKERKGRFPVRSPMPVQIVRIPIANGLIIVIPLRKVKQIKGEVK